LSRSSIKTTSDAVQKSSGRSSNSWNQFLKNNKGRYKGKGWQQRAAKDYHKSQ